MAKSKGAKGDGTKFEVKADLENSPHPVLLIQCAHRRAVVGVLPVPVEKM
jgi:hypothetical protein